MSNSHGGPAGVHTVPAPVAMAVNSARSEFLKIDLPKTLTPEEIAGVYGVLGELIDLQYASQKKIQGLDEKLETAQEQLDKIKAAARNILMAANVIGTSIET
jgi:hypothetical protein